MDEALKQRLVGAAVLAVIAVITVPWLLGKPESARRERVAPRPVVSTPAVVVPETIVQAETQAHADAHSRASAVELTHTTGEPLRAQPAPTRAPASVLGAWFVQLAAFSSAENAQKLQGRLRKLGQASEVRVDGAYWLVFAGPYAAKSTATQARGGLERRTGLRGVVRGPST